MEEQSREQVSVQKGLKIPRYFTKEGIHPFDMFTYDKRVSSIKSPEGATVFRMENVEVPTFWSQVATDILSQKYFRKKGVPLKDENDELKRDVQGNSITGSENSIKQVAHRLAGCWRLWGEQNNYFASPEDAQHFYEEMLYMIINQSGAPNSPQWFTTGLHFAYGITGQSQGHSYVDPVTKTLTFSKDAYTRSQPHACAEYYTQVYTEEGTKYIGDIVEQDLKGLKVFDGEKFVSIIATKNNGEKEVFRITLKNGNRIDLTEDHLVLSAKKKGGKGGNYSWNHVRDLTVGNKLQQPLLLDIKEKNVFIRDLAKARLAGWIIGDGTVGIYQNIMRIEVITVNDDEHYAVLRDIHEVFGEKVSYWTTTFDTKEENLNGKRIHLEGKKIHNFLKEFELVSMRRRTTKVPTKILASSPQEKREFLKALFQADGRVRIRIDETRNSGDICLTTASKNLSFGVLQLLNSLGIYSRISQNKDSRENMAGTDQVVIAYGSAREQYSQQIGFISTEKHDKLLLLNKVVQRSQTLPLIREETIVSIEKIGIKNVYDIQTESGKFLGNGIVVHNCFIQRVDDDLVNPGGIFSLLVREARIFKYGSGTGSNFSNLRGNTEILSGGGKSSGLMSFLKVFDAAAGAIKSGGTTRRAAKMVCLDLDHPEIENFVWWKTREEEKVASLVTGSKTLKQCLTALIASAKGKEEPLQDSTVRKHLKRAIRENIPVSYLARTLELAKQGYSMPLQEFDTYFESEAYLTVSGQNSNNSVRIPNAFFSALEMKGDWNLIARTDKSVIKTVRAAKLWDDIGYCAWASADPGVQYDTTINEWHTCPAGGRINGSNPCSEYMFLDDTACNLASINLLKFYDDETGRFDIQGYRHAIRLWTIVLEISIFMAQFPSEPIARLSYEYRSLGLGYANIGSLLMMQGIPYDSDKARTIAGAMAAVMTGDSYATSAEMAKSLGPFERYNENKESMLRVIRNHRRAAYGVTDYEGLTITPQSIHQQLCPRDLLEAAHNAWDNALRWGEQYGYRNAQATVIAPTGTIGLVMDCDTTGVEPDYALVKYKKLIGGGFFKIINKNIPRALKRFRYTPEQVIAMIKYCLGHGTLSGSPYINKESLRAKGMNNQQLNAIESELKNTMDMSYVFNKWTVGKDMYDTVMRGKKGTFLEALGFTPKEIAATNEYVCGTMTLEGAPHLKEEHLAVFDCANPCGKKGRRYIHPYGHLKMVAAVQSFISGAISKTVNMPSNWTVDQIKQAYYDGWKMMTKAIALYRDGCKLSQPLNTTLEGNSEWKNILANLDEEEIPVNEKRKTIPLGSKKLQLVGVLDNEKLSSIRYELEGMVPTQQALMDALVNSVNFGLQQGHDPSHLATSNLNVEGHPMITALATFLHECGTATPTVMSPLATSTSAAYTILSEGGEKETCSSCGATQMRQNGTCKLCEICGETSGCS